jgi:hypothetical protein
LVDSGGASVAEISRFFGVVIRMFFDDHQPPHLHAQYGEDSALVAIQPISVIETTLPTRALSMVLEWTALHQEEFWKTGSGSTRRVHPRRSHP